MRSPLLALFVCVNVMLVGCSSKSITEAADLVFQGGAVFTSDPENPTANVFQLEVAANKEIRNMLVNLCKEKNYDPIFPPIELCGDNAAMIAMVGLEKFKLKKFNNLDYPAKPRWPLDEGAAFLKGAGVKL